MIRVEVAVAAPLEETLTYLFRPNPKCNQIPVGKRVLVPLGGRLVTGYVLDSVPEEEVNYDIREIREVLDNNPLFQSNQVPFFRWIARYYHYPIGQVIQTALPGGLTTRSVKQIQLTQKGQASYIQWPSETLPEPQWFEKLCQAGTLSVAVSSKILKNTQTKKIISSFQEKELVEIHERVQQDRIKEKNEPCLRLAPSLQAENTALTDDDFTGYYQHLKKDFDSSLKLSEAKTLFHLSRLSQSEGDRPVPKKELNRTYSGASKALKALKEKTYVRLYEERVYRNPFGEQLSHFPRPEKLSESQTHVIDKLIGSLHKKTYAPYLLHGVTGSGKTEVYLRAAEETLKLGRDVIVLVPEIALATQLESHFVSRFKDQVVLLHSALSAGEKFDQWSLAVSGAAKIVIGARSAVFAPLKDPGLIVVDEEHDQGFKQDTTLRYQGRDLAVLRALQQDAVVVLGSATPSILSYHHADQGKYGLLEMGERIGGRSLPEVTIVDLRRKTAPSEKKVIRRELQEALSWNLKEKKQSILLLNRRGFSGTLLCQDCGSTVECLHCHVSLTFHKQKERLVCHYCGYTLSAKTICSSCRSTQLVPVGFGTERVEEEARLLLPEARIERLDSDTASDRKKFLKILKSMHHGEIDILIGTQMIAKGHHFPNVTLVGIVWADGGLNMPDFRASERIFQLVSQVTGRAGRGDTPGKVIIQTMRPDHYSLLFAQKHHYADFFHHELAIRKNPAFPPFVRLVAIRISGEREYDVRGTAQNIARTCRGFIKKLGSRVDLLGPAPSPLDRLCDRFRWQLLLKSDGVDDLHFVCSQITGRKNHLSEGKSRISIDVDPENMM